jgi:hypothetical protein
LVEESIDRGTQWVVFESNDEPPTQVVLTSAIAIAPSVLNYSG